MGQLDRRVKPAAHFTRAVRASRRDVIVQASLIFTQPQPSMGQLYTVPIVQTNLIFTQPQLSKGQLETEPMVQADLIFTQPQPSM